MLPSDIVIVVFLLALNAFFALSELAVVSSSKPVLRQKAKQGNKSAELALQLAEDPGRFLSTVQVGITLVGILAGAYGGATIAGDLAPLFDQISFIQPHGEVVAFVIVVSAITFFWVVIGELIPKQLALAHSEQLAMIAARPMWIMSVVCTPIVKLLDVSADLVLRIFGYRVENGSRVTEAEVKAVIAEGVESGVIEETEHTMLTRIIRLGDRDVQSIMTHRMDVTFIDVNDSLETIHAKIKEAGHSRYPVIDGGFDKVLGVLNAKDLIAWVEKQDGQGIRPLIKPLPALSGGVNCLKALDLFKSSKAHIALVIDEYGTTEGIVTASDLLEAIVGVLPSNYGAEEEAQIITREDGSWLVDGLTPVDELYLTLGLDVFDEDPDYKTIAGFIINGLGRAPHESDSFEKAGYRFEVVDMDGRRIDKVLISKTGQPATSNH